ncbi:hypothetical protein [Lutibaculum baratangense]|uniref:Uncharacterized protein n=1 Tax=Lutibaculum baratangense AMV1 TaxID=631454 RepID=V4RMI2_9HYPH|nr:hypothetical protein [Lutibaculum baratangense]ESR27241.1 hypothetical protein N177_0220 [Lutibaculum baratangense AMV1]
MRVDREAQEMERLEAEVRTDPFPLVLDVPRGVRIPDSGTFVIGDVTYLVAGVTPRGLRDVCTESDGRRIACGARARVGLWNLVAEKRLACRQVGGKEDAALVECSLGGETLGERLLREGWALPRTEPDLAPAKTAGLGESD